MGSLRSIDSYQRLLRMEQLRCTGGKYEYKKIKSLTYFLSSAYTINIDKFQLEIENNSKLQIMF